MKLTALSPFVGKVVHLITKSGKAHQGIITKGQSHYPNFIHLYKADLDFAYPYNDLWISVDSIESIAEFIDVANVKTNVISPGTIPYGPADVMTCYTCGG